jgi:putative ATP-dependent endonuclease of OLD family
VKLESVQIKRFRSVESGELARCGDFNVLIGKNNSGKSNILSAIYAFFHYIGSGNAVSLKSPSLRDVDFFGKKTDLSIEINLIFSLLLAERDALIRDIVTEAPQMKNAADGLDPTLRLSTTVSITPPPRSFGFVSKIALRDTIRPSTKRPDSERILLKVDEEAANELYNHLYNYNQKVQDADALLNIDKDRFRYTLDAWKEDKRHMPFRFFVERTFTSGLSDQSLQLMEALFAEPSSYEDALRSITTLAAKLHKEAESLREEPLRHRISTFTGEASSIPDYVRSLLRRVAEMKVHYLRERRKPIGKEEAERLLHLKVRRGGTQVLSSIQDTVSSLLGVQIDAFEGSSSSRRESAAEMDVDDFLVELNGSGIREALRIVLDVEFEHPDLLLIEEPEMHLHPSLETSMMRYLKRIGPDCQVFISTHSTNFLDTGEMKNVYLISKTDSTRIQLLDYEEAENQIPKELGIRLSSLFMFDRLVFVEGSSDEAILREWASALTLNLSRSNVGFIHMGGVRNFTHYAAEAILSFLTKRQVQMWFILDRDERNDDEITKLKEMVGERADVRTLERREIESYLLCPRAIVRFIARKRELSQVQFEEELPTESDIENTIRRCASELKQIAIDKRVVKILCRPVYLSTKRLFEDSESTTVADGIAQEIRRSIKELEEAKSRIQSVYEEQTKVINDVWASIGSHIVPGDLLLDLVCQQYGVRFKKDRDGVRLASLMDETEIDREVKEIIHSIGISQD